MRACRGSWGVRREICLGLPCYEVEVAGGTHEARGGADGLEATGLVAGALEARLVHEAHDTEDGVFMALGPVVAEATEGEG